MTGLITGSGSDARGFVAAVLPPGTINGMLAIALGGGMLPEGGAIPLVVPCMLMPVPGVVTAGPTAVRLVLVPAAVLAPGAPVTGPPAACACGTGGVELSAVKRPSNLVMKLSMDAARALSTEAASELASTCRPSRLAACGALVPGPESVGGSGLESTSMVCDSAYCLI